MTHAGLLWVLPPQGHHKVIPHKGTADDNKRKDIGAGEQDSVLSVTGFSHKNSRFFQQYKRQKTDDTTRAPEERVVETEPAHAQQPHYGLPPVPARWRAGVEDIFQLFSKK